jgi:hypothetical protein
MNTTEGFGNVLNPSQRSTGFGRGKKYPGAEVPDLGKDFGDSIIMEEAYTIFESQGERRSVRSIAEYCKNGELICDYDSDDKRWHISRESVDNKIKKIKDLNARRAPIAPTSTSEHFSEDPPPPPRPTEETPPRYESTTPPSEDTKKLEQEIIDLKIINKAKDYYIGKLEEEQKFLITRIETSGRIIGRLKHKLFLLVAPSSSNDTLPPAPIESASPPATDVPPDGTLSDNVIDTYEHSSPQPLTAEQT